MRTTVSTCFAESTRRLQTVSLVAIGLLGLWSCHQFPNTEVPIDAENAKTYQGRIAFKGPQQSFVVVFRWVETDFRFQLTLRDRLALGGVRLEGDEATARVEYANGDIEEDVNLDAWIADNLGVAIPFRELWDCLSLSCALIDNAAQAKYDRFDRLESFLTHEWTFKLTYRDSARETAALKHLELQSNGTTIKVVFTKFEN